MQSCRVRDMIRSKKVTCEIMLSYITPITQKNKKKLLKEIKQVVLKYEKNKSTRWSLPQVQRWVNDHDESSTPKEVDEREKITWYHGGNEKDNISINSASK